MHSKSLFPFLVKTTLRKEFCLYLVELWKCLTPRNIEWGFWNFSDDERKLCLAKHASYNVWAIKKKRRSPIQLRMQLLNVFLIASASLVFADDFEALSSADAENFVDGQDYNNLVGDEFNSWGYGSCSNHLAFRSCYGAAYSYGQSNCYHLQHNIYAYQTCLCYQNIYNTQCFGSFCSGHHRAHHYYDQRDRYCRVSHINPAYYQHQYFWRVGHHGHYYFPKAHHWPAWRHSHVRHAWRNPNLFHRYQLGHLDGLTEADAHSSAEGATEAPSGEYSSALATTLSGALVFCIAALF